jgi:hypothetical protein
LALTQRSILRLYWPLALSWLFMAVEGPVAIGIISRLPQAEVNQAAFVALMGLSIFIESPVIDLLATSTTLATDRARYLALRNFTLLVMAAVTAIHALVALTPLFDVIAYGALALDPSVGEVLRPAMAIMIPWSAFIGWRRFLQGVMIRNGQTRAVGAGTVLRLATLIATGLALFSTTRMTGVSIVAIALVASVAVECLFVQLLARGAVRRTLGQPAAPGTMGLRALAGFHFPLTASTVLVMSTSPMIVATLGRAAEPVAMQAAWAVGMSFLWLFRTVTYALPEAVIALYRQDPSRRGPLGRFCVAVGLGASSLLFLTTVTPLDGWFFVQVLQADPRTSALAGTMLLFTSMVPLCNAAMSYFRALLTAHYMTSARLLAIAVAVVTMASSLYLGLLAGLPGYALPGLGLTLGHAAELGVLRACWRRLQGRS